MLEVDVIMRTLAEGHRREMLEHALATMQAQQGVSVTPVVVVNGQRFDPGLVADLEARTDIRYEYLPEPSASKALKRGRELVTAPFFAFLDDDDELIEHTLGTPVDWLASHDDCDVAITAVRNRSQALSSDAPRDMKAAEKNPLFALMQSCWLHPGGAVFRTATVGPDILDLRSQMEWTELAFRLATRGLKLHFMEPATVVYNDTPGSISKNAEHQENAVEVLEQIMAHPACDSATQALARDKYCNTMHVLAKLYWDRGQRRKAWERHLQSLRKGGFLKYLLFTRKLLVPRSAPAPNL